MYAMIYQHLNGPETQRLFVKLLEITRATVRKTLRKVSEVFIVRAQGVFLCS